MMQMSSLSLFERKFGNKAEIITFVLVLSPSSSLADKVGPSSAILPPRSLVVVGMRIY